MTSAELRTWREGRGLGLRALARLLEVEASTLLRWERGDRRMPGAWLTLALAALDCQRNEQRQPPARRAATEAEA